MSFCRDNELLERRGTQFLENGLDLIRVAYLLCVLASLFPGALQALFQR